MKLIRRAAIVTAASATLVLGLATAAHAGTDNVSSIDGSWTRFISNGDKFENCDTGADFLLAYMEYQYVRVDGSLQTGTHQNPGGSGDCAIWTHKFTAGRTVWFRSCTDNFLFPDTCDRWRTGIA